MFPGVGYHWFLIIWMNTYTGGTAVYQPEVEFPSYNACVVAAQISVQMMSQNYKNSKSGDSAAEYQDSIPFGYFINYTCLPKDFNGSVQDFLDHQNTY